MVVTVALVKKVFEEADIMMKKVFHGLYDSPKFSSVKITNANGYWMKITRYSSSSSYGLKVSKLFENHTNDEEAMHRLKESLIHELVHTLPGAFNHGVYFKEYGRMFHSYYPDFVVDSVGSEAAFAPNEDFGVPGRHQDFSARHLCTLLYFVHSFFDCKRYCPNRNKLSMPTSDRQLKPFLSAVAEFHSTSRSELYHLGSPASNR